MLGTTCDDRKWLPLSNMSAITGHLIGVSVVGLAFYESSWILALNGVQTALVVLLNTVTTAKSQSCHSGYSWSSKTTVVSVALI